MGMQENNMSKHPSLEATEEELELEFQEIMKKRMEYQNEVKQETISFQKEEAVRRRKRWFHVAKAAMIVLVIGTCFVLLATKSEATRMWWLDSVERIIGTDTGRVVNNDENRIISETTLEEAIADIEDKTGIPMPEMQYEPLGLIFDGYDYDETILRGGLYYLYKDYVVFLSARTANDDTSYYWNYNGDVISEKVVDTAYGSVKLLEIKAADDANSSIAAEWTYLNHQYQLVGKIPMEEMEKIILNILY